MAKHPNYTPVRWHLQPPAIDKIVFGFIFVLISLILPFHDPDFYWHIKTGEYLFSAQSLPTTDIFSFTQEGQPWVLHEWLSQSILFWVYSSFGFPGLRILTGLLFTLTFYIINRLSYSLSANLFHSTMVTGIFLIYSLPNCSPRPQLFTFLFLAIFLYILLRLKYMNEKRRLILLPLIMVIWANAHGGYLIGIVLVGIFWLTEMVRCFFYKTAGETCSATFRVLSMTLVATLIASLLTPYTYELWIYPFEVMGMEASKSFITEWQSPDFHGLLYQAYLAVIMIYGAILIYSSRKPDLTELVLSGSFIFLGFLATRNIPLTVIVIAPLFALFARYLDFPRPGLEQAAVAHGPSHSATSLNEETYSRKETTETQSGTGGWILLLLCVIAAFTIHTYQKQQDPEIELNKTLPVAAVEFIKNNNISGRMLNNYNYGGYLIYEFYPDQKVFIDGRADMYGDEFIREYINIYHGGTQWKELLDKYSIDYALVGKNAPISQLLNLSNDFVLIHDDRDHALYIKKSPQYRHIIDQYARH
jgi:hypothetical protein